MAKILIVEDDQALSQVLQKKLEFNGYEVSVAPDGEVAMAELGKSKPDIILLDIVMPKMNGYEVLEKLHSDPSLSQIPVIIISNSGQPVEIERTKELGAADYIIKANFEPNEVLDKINAHLGTAKKKKEEPLPAVKDANAGTHSVLIVEDDKFLRDLLALKLKKEGFKVSEAVDGEEGINKARSERPHIIVLDLIIPGKDGFAFLEEMKQDPQISSIPVIVLSNLGQREDIERAKNLGAKDYMIKAQLTPIEVVERVKAAIREAYI